MALVGLLCLALGILSVAAGRRIALEPYRPDRVSAPREEWRSLARAVLVVGGVFLLVGGLILILAGFTASGAATSTEKPPPGKTSAAPSSPGRPSGRGGQG